MKTKSLRTEKTSAAQIRKKAPPGWSASLTASLTVEAAIVLPLFLFFMMNVLFLLDVVRLQSRVTAALQQAGDQICEYAWYREYAFPQSGGGGASGAEPGGSGGSTGGSTGGSVGGRGAGGSGAGSSGLQIPQGAGDILSLAFVSGQVRNRLGSTYMNSTCLRGGAGGISYLHSRILDDRGIVEIHADYRTRPFIPILAGPDLSIRSTYYGHAWTGYTIGSGIGDAEDGSDSAQEGSRVIVAENGVVYHTDPDCVYLKPDVRSANASDLDHLRANDGSIYHACEYCHPSRSGTIYITPDGNRYHSSPDCSRLTRTTHEETADEAAGHLRPCPKCGHAHSQ